jgi:hypothetical protein
VFPVFTGVLVIAPIPLVLTELIVPLTVLVHVYVVVPMVLAGVKFNAVPLHIVFCNCTAVFVITGTGFTVAVTFSVEPEQPLAVGVMV